MSVLRVPIRSGTLSSSRWLDVPNQEWMMAAVLRAGRVVSTLTGDLYAEVLDMTMTDESHLVFSMNILEWSKLCETNATFRSSGLLGWWKIEQQEAVSGKPPKITFQQTYTDVSTVLESVLSHKNSAPFIRDRYASLLASINKDDDA